MIGLCETCVPCAKCGRATCLEDTARLCVCGSVVCEDHECPDCPTEAA